MKKEKIGNVIAIFLIILLSSFIIMPPVLRAFTKEEEIVIPDRLILLKCTKKIDNLTINVDSIYNNKNLNKTSIMFTLAKLEIDETLPEVEKEPVLPDEVEDIKKLDNEEFLLLKEDPNISFLYKELSASTTLLYTNSYIDKVMDKYHLPMNELQVLLEDDSYICNIIK